MRALRRAWATLTGRRYALVDRADLMAALRKRSRGGAPFAVVLLGLDGFAAVNDMYGRDVGDAVLAQVGAKLALLAGEYRGTVAARLRGDEFALIAPSPQSVISQTWGYEALCAVAAVVVDGLVSFQVRTSVGVVHGRPGADPARLLHAADTALFEAKVSGGDAVVVYDTDAELPTVDTAPPVRLRDMAAVERAVAQGVGPA